MRRFIIFLSLVVAAVHAPALAAESPGSSTPPLTYELMINGESFLIEADRQVKLESREKPGVTYEVALRIAPEQPVRLSRFEFVYDWPAKVEDDRGRPCRTVRVQHELGYTMLIADLGRLLDDDSQDKTLQLLRESTIQGFEQAGMTEITAADLPSRQFPGFAGRGVAIHGQDDKGLGHTCLVYLMGGPNFTGYCVIEYLDADQANVLPKVKKTLDSVRAIP